METRHHRQPAFFRKHHRVCLGGVEILAVLDQFGAKGTHGGVFLAGVSHWHDNGAGKSVARGREGHALPVVAPRGGYDA